METPSPNARELETLILLIDPVNHDARAHIAGLRDRMDQACERQQITLAEWRSLVDLITGVRSQCEGANDLRGNNGTSVTR